MFPLHTRCTDVRVILIFSAIKPRTVKLSQNVKLVLLNDV